MIDRAFEELKKEARCGVVKFQEDAYPLSIRVLFNIVDEKELNNMPNIYIEDKDSFKKLLYKYVVTALKFHNLEATYNNIKEILTYAFVNITPSEMKSLDKYIEKYITFYNNRFNSISGEKSSSLGSLKYVIAKQSYKQETPFCFKSYFEKETSMYVLPRISFGIKDGVCYIYAIQNKDTNMNTNSEYNMEVREKLRVINSGISKYRNVTPSFVIALALFASYLKENNINKISVVTPLPIRMANREASANERIKFQTLKCDISSEDLEKFKKEINDKRIMDDYNATVKFVNCFNRLKLYFDNMYLKNINNDIILEIINLSTNNDFLREIIGDNENMKRR